MKLRLPDWKVLRAWRFQETDEGSFCFFDPRREVVAVRDLIFFERVDRLVMHGSVSAVGEGEGALRKDEQREPENRLLPFVEE